MAMQIVPEGQASGNTQLRIYPEPLSCIVAVALEPVRRLLHLMEYGDQEDPSEGPLGHAGMAAGALLDHAEEHILTAIGKVEKQFDITVGCLYPKTGHIPSLWDVEFTPRSGGKLVATAANEGEVRRRDLEAAAGLAEIVWEYFEFLRESFITTRTESLYPMQVRGLKQVLFDLSEKVDEMGKCLGLVQVRTVPPGPGAHVPELADYKGQAAEHGELPTAAFALNDTFGFLDQVFISRKGGLDDTSLDGLRRVLRSIHGQVDNLLNLAEAAHAQQAGQAGEAKPNRVVPFKAPATPAEPAPAQGPPAQAAAGGLRFARDLDPAATPAPRRAPLWWLNPRNWTK